MMVTTQEVLEEFVEASRKGKSRDVAINREMRGNVTEIRRTTPTPISIQPPAPNMRLCLSPERTAHWVDVSHFQPKGASCDACRVAGRERAMKRKQEASKAEMMGWVEGVVTRIDVEKNVMAVDCSDGVSVVIVGTRSFYVGSRLMLRKVSVPVTGGNIDTWEIVGVK